MSTLLELKDVKSGYGRMQIINGIDLKINQGDFVALIGPNGAGKSTVLKTIFGMTDFRHGQIEFNGKNLMRMKPHEIVKEGISYIHQGKNIFPNMSVQENLEMGSYILENNMRTKENLLRAYEMFPILEKKRKDLAKSLSGGQQQMLALARATMLEPKLLMLDEPSIGLAPNIVDMIFEKIKLINSQGVTILMVEQNVQEALRHARNVHILRLGKIEFSGTPKQIMRKEVLQKAYLG